MTGPRHRTILVVDDARETLELLRRRLESRGFDVVLASSVDEAIETLGKTACDLVVTDLRLPGRSGMDLVRHVRERYRETAVIMVTGYATIQGAVDAVKSGAQEYLAKPFTNAELRDAVDRALTRADEARLARAARESMPGDRFGLVGVSSGMRVAFAEMQEALATDRPVLFLGEPGTGRRAAARALLAARAAGSPMLDLVASDPRAFETAGAAGAGGALLRHAEALAPEALPALRRLASSLAKRGIRLLASASPIADAEDDAERRRVWDALRSHRVFLPPLRERGEDVHLLAAHFAARASRGERRPQQPPFDSDATRVFDDYAWPGNVAELEQVVAGALSRSHGETIAASHLPAWLRPTLGAAGDVQRSLADVELEHIARVLRQTRGNRSRAAEILGINRRTLGEKLKGRNGQKT